ncbi:MAG: RecX family transcriptional regulator [Actinomycetota bacterium]|nr:RecX family transcriptional regulator [Actinomycetota bacterium]
MNRLAQALDLAYRHLAKRDRTEMEVRRHLRGRGVEDPTIEQAVAELERQGYVDDARYARRFAEDRRTLDAWGAERIEQRLLSLGIAPEVVAEAVAEQPAEDELDAAVALLRRRLPEPPQDDRARNRALGLLVRRGYELELAHDAIRALARGG